MQIRRGVKEDLPKALDLIRELAEYEKELDNVSNTVQMMEEDGFGDTPVFGFFVAEDSHKNIVGLALYYYKYSTWKGKRLYLEDLIVTQRERGKGIGKQLFNAVIVQGKTTGCSGMSWQVLNWNEPAINFYDKYYNAAFDSEWVNCRIEW